MNLRFVARDGDAIILESDQGERFQVLIDESMRDALKNNPRVSGADFSPKLVQDLIRAGLSIDEVAAEVGQEVNAISPFAAPILDELRYVLDAALETEVSDGVSMMRFQDLVARTGLPCIGADSKQERYGACANVTRSGCHVWVLQPVRTPVCH